jgi:hypothetical protein
LLSGLRVESPANLARNRFFALGFE